MAKSLSSKKFHIIVTGEANFSMESTCLTVGGFSQPSVARSLIEQSGSAEIGLSQHFLWLFPQPSYCRFSTLEGVDKEFSDYLGKNMQFTVKMNSEHHYLVVISVAKCGDGHYISPQISLPSSDVIIVTTDKIHSKQLNVGFNRIENEWMRNNRCAYIIICQ